MNNAKHAMIYRYRSSFGCSP